jgi:hypothetical protein
MFEVDAARLDEEPVADAALEDGQIQEQRLTQLSPHQGRNLNNVSWNVSASEYFIFRCNPLKKLIFTLSTIPRQLSTDIGIEQVLFYTANDSQYGICASHYCGWDEYTCGWDLAEWLENLTSIAKDATVLGSVLASSDTGAANEAVLNKVHNKIILSLFLSL